MESSDIQAKAEIKLKLLKADRYARLHIEKSTVQINSILVARITKQDPISFKILDGVPGDTGVSGSVLRLNFWL
jgi:hypothetical protein